MMLRRRGIDKVGLFGQNSSDVVISDEKVIYLVNYCEDQLTGDLWPLACLLPRVTQVVTS